MFCTKCGAQIGDEAAFCEQCGARTRRGQSSDPASNPTEETKPHRRAPSPISDFMAWCMVGLECAIALYLGLYVFQNGFFINSTGYEVPQYLAFLADCALRLLCAKMDSDVLTTKGYPAPSIAWAFFFPPIYLYRRGKALQRPHTLPALLSFAAMIASTGIFVSAEIRRAEVEATASRTVSGIIRERFSMDVQCLKVKLTKRLFKGNYEALAQLSNGRALPIQVLEQQEDVFVSLRPAPLLLDELFSNLLSLGDQDTFSPAEAESVDEKSRDRRNATNLVSSLRSLKAATFLFYADHAENGRERKVMELVNGQDGIAQLKAYLDNPERYGERYSISLWDASDGSQRLMVVCDLSGESEGVRQALQERARSIGLYEGRSQSLDDFYAGGDSVCMVAMPVNLDMTPRITQAQRAELSDAFRSGSAARLKEVLQRERLSPDMMFEDGELLLRVAVKESPNADTIKALLALGANVNAERRDGRTALTAAADGGPLDVVKALLDAGANVNAKNRHTGWTVLMFALKEANPDVVRLLLNSGADVAAENSDGQTPLAFAVLQGASTNVLKMLLDAGADIEARDGDDNTPLILAAQYTSNPDVLLVLLDAGADAGARNAAGLTALDLASTNPNLDGAPALQKLRKKTQ